MYGARSASNKNICSPLYCYDLLYTVKLILGVRKLPLPITVVPVLKKITKKCWFPVILTVSPNERAGVLVIRILAIIVAILVIRILVLGGRLKQWHNRLANLLLRKINILLVHKCLIVKTFGLQKILRTSRNKQRNCKQKKIRCRVAETELPWSWRIFI